MPFSHELADVAREWLRVAIDSLNLALRHLGLELEVLANPINGPLVERVSERTRRGSRRPK
jgi:hypothetical protein